MVFSSLAFIFRFMPLFFLCYFLTPKPFRNIVLFLGSIIFYAVGEPVYVLLMLFSILVNFMLCVHMAREKRARQRKWLLGCILILDFGMLFLFKYYDFAAQNVNLLLHREAVPMLNLTLPLGISFYTFQIASYAADIYRRKMKHTGTLLEFATYVSMFPQLIAGPIVQYQEVSSELESRKTTLYSIEKGLEIFCFGLGAKVLLANKIWIFWNQIQGIGYANLSTPAAWMGAVAYSFHIYFDFWGYSLMAIGLGHMLGFHLPRNFESPYMVKSVTEFWRKWHMTLGRFFREYVYIPLGGNRKGNLRMLINMLIVWSLTGLWHGASWNFVLWGLGFFVLLSLEKFIYGKFLENSRIIGHIYIWILIPVTWVVFAIPDLEQLAVYLQQLAGIHRQPVLVSTDQLMRYVREYGRLFAACAFFSTGLPKRIYYGIRGGIVVVALALAVFWMSVYELANGINNPFLYFRF
ncbi:MAG: MBOAT family protein [Eubacterium sp.]|jgi:alginate O-acetyltransferase complex protein AlgI|nr:MBOAT family protein [Eubacterium sp.]